MYQDPGYKGYRLRDNVTMGGSRSILADMYEDAYDADANLKYALGLMEESADGRARVFYARLLSLAHGDDKEIISGMMDDDLRHEGIINRIYYEITNETLPEPVHTAPTKPASYRRELEAGLMHDQLSIKKYRSMLFAMRTSRHINMMTEILTDKIRHLALYSYLLSKNIRRI